MTGEAPNETYTIERKPLPSGSGGRGSTTKATRTLRLLKVGESFDVPRTEATKARFNVYSENKVGTARFESRLLPDGTLRIVRRT